MDWPQVILFDAAAGEEDAARELAQQVASAGVGSPFVLSSVHGRVLASELALSFPVEQHIASADQQWAADLGSRVKRSGADAIVAIGGGRCLDVAKLAATRAGVAVIAAPTQLSHDGICSPVAVVPDASARRASVGAIAPRVVFISLPTLLNAPSVSVAAGLGDLLANPLALRDWALAAERGLEQTDQRAWDLSVESFELVKKHLDDDPQISNKDPVFLRGLADALVLSGMAMIWAGTSRPASGAEHEISHSIDELHGGRALHGAQVAFGCIISVALYGEDTRAFRARLARLRLPHHPRDLGLGQEDLVRLILHAPETRPGRFTVLEEANLDEVSARALVRRIWEDL